MCVGMETRHHGPCLENTKQFGMKHTHAVHGGQVGWQQAASRNSKERNSKRPNQKPLVMLRIWTIS